MQTKLYKFAAYFNIGIGVLGILSFLVLAYSEQARGGEPLSKWIPALVLAVLCVIIGATLLRVGKKP